MVGGSIHDRLVRAARAEAQALPVNLRGRLPPPTAPVQAVSILILHLKAT